MKDTRFNNALKDISSVTMTDAERRAMIARIMGEGVRTGRSVVSPWSMYSFGNMIARHRSITAVVVVLIVLVGGGGVIGASQSALPGDTLYAMKVDVTEPLQVALTVDPVARAEIRTDLLQKRLEEVETLAANDRLDSTSKDRAYARVEKQAADIHAHIDDVERISSDAADDVNATIEASIRAHQRVLASISRKSASSPTSHAVKPVAARSMMVQDIPSIDPPEKASMVGDSAGPVSALVSVGPDGEGSDTEQIMTESVVDPGSEHGASSVPKTKRVSSFTRSTEDERAVATTSQDRTERFKKAVREKEEEYIKRASERLKKESMYSEIRRRD